MQTKPMDYLPFVELMRCARVILTDSGGIQEECASIGIPVVICRKETERQEVLKLNIGKLTGFNSLNILKVLNWAKKKAKFNNSG